MPEFRNYVISVLSSHIVYSRRSGVRKEGPAFDLAIALALLAIDEQIDCLALQNFIALGELALDGTLRPVNGILPMVIGARNAGFTKLILPQNNGDEAALVEGIELYAVDSLASAVSVLLGNGAKWRRTTKAPQFRPEDEFVHGDLADVRGQLVAKRALEIAAAGGHNLLFVGPPGCGKTMLARRLPSILPQGRRRTRRSTLRRSTASPAC